MTWTVKIDASAEREIGKLPPDLQARLFVLIEVIEQEGLGYLPPKATKHIKDGLWELRVKDRSGIARAFYITVAPKQLVILSAFQKKTQKAPQRELNKAERRRKKYDD